MRDDRKKEPELLLSFSDLVRICKRGKKKVLYSGAIFCCLGMLYALTRPIEFRSEATFREKGITQSPISRTISSILLTGGDGNESEAVTLMKSRKLLSELVVKKGLQAEIVKKERKNPLKIFSLIKKNLSIELAHFRKQRVPVFEDKKNDLAITQLVFNEEIPRTFEILFKSEEDVEIKDHATRSITAGKINQPIKIGSLEFAVERLTDSPLKSQTFLLTLSPLNNIADDLSKSFSIETDRIDKGLIKLGYKSGNRSLVSEHLNNLMAIYQEYIQREHQRIANIQIDYLMQRQQEMNQDLETVMVNHAKDLSEHAIETGNPFSIKAMEFLSITLQEYKKNFLHLDLEEQILTEFQSNGVESYDKLMSQIFPPMIRSLSNEIRAYKQQADSLDLALREFSPIDAAIQASFIHQLSQLQEIELSSRDVKALITAFKEEALPTPPKTLLDNPNFIVNIWYEKLVDAYQGLKQTTDSIGQNQEWRNCREGFIAYLDNLLHYLDVHQRTIQERLSNQQPENNEFQGINLRTSADLYLSYSKELSDVQSKIVQTQFIVDRMNSPEFEITSLSTVLQDPVSINMIDKASALILSLKDEDNRSSREHDRLKTEITVHKGFLNTHLNQSVQILELRENLLKNKLRQVQNINLSLIHEQISILQEQMKEFIGSRISELQKEKSVQKKHINELQNQIGMLPDSWMTEKMIEQQMNLNQKMVEELTKLVESKNISNKLEMIQSAPIDLATRPILPKSPRLMIYAIFGAVAGSFIGLAWLLVGSIYKGIEASEENLTLAQQTVCGSLIKAYKDLSKDPLLDHDLNTLRRIVSFIDSTPKKKEVLLLESSGPHYVFNLAELMSKSGAKIIVLPLSFDEPSHPNQLPGLLQYLEEKAEQPKIHHKAGCDYISVGGLSRYSNELLNSNRFYQLLESLKQQYDIVLAYSKVAPSEAEAEHLLKVFDTAVISVAGETLDSLKNCFTFINEHSSDKKVAFIIAQMT